MIPAYDPATVRTAERSLVAGVDPGAPDTYMLRAARAVADAAMLRGGVGAGIVAVAGGGDNGGDALYAAAMLAEDGADVRVVLVADHPHERAVEAARGAGVPVERAELPVSGVPSWLGADILIDGIVGSGLSGALREPLADLVTTINEVGQRLGMDIIAVDVPSGVGGADGRLAGPAIAASHTVTMGGLKAPLILPPAALMAGSVEIVDLGIDPHSLGDPSAYLVTAEDAIEHARVPGAWDHKYTRGVVTVAAGSDTYPGAGVLVTAGALGVGLGMVRLESSGRTARVVLDRFPGVVTAPGRAQATVVGSGLDAESEPRAKVVAMKAVSRGIPLVIDAGGFGFVGEMLSDGAQLGLAVLTPHAGEAAGLLSELDNRAVSREEVEANPGAAARALVRLTGASVVLKGAVTVVVGTDGTLASVTGAPGWTGVAGAGDVLAGVIAGALAQAQVFAETSAESAGEGVDVARVAACATWIHSRAAGLASGVTGHWLGSQVGHPIRADEIAAWVPEVIAELIEARHAEEHRRRKAVWMS